jgi:hypothetical protein
MIKMVGQNRMIILPARQRKPPKDTRDKITAIINTNMGNYIYNGEHDA